MRVFSCVGEIFRNFMWLKRIPYGYKVFIYGAGEYGHYIRDVLAKERSDLEFVGFIETYRDGFNIIKWEEFKRRGLGENEIIIIGSCAFWKDMVENVKEMRFKYIVPCLDVYFRLWGKYKWKK